MNILFYLVHPAKFHFHKVQINELKARGHHIDVIINTKDILEDLVLEEGWEYKNIFPEGRKIKGVHVYIAAIISIFRTVIRLWHFTKSKKYDLFIGDLLTILGRLKRVPSLYATDNDLTSVPEQTIFFRTANYIIAPIITDLGKYQKKSIRYNGYKALAHLHPNQYNPDISRLSKDLQNNEHFFLIRCTGFYATHDISRKGISDDLLIELVRLLTDHGKVIISSERPLPPELKEYELSIKKKDITHYIYYAKILIGDSTTMSAEAAVLGTPSIEFDDYFYRIKQMIELEEKYNLIHCFRTDEQIAFLKKITELVETKDLKRLYTERRKIFLNDSIDVSGFLIWFFENYPDSLMDYYKDQNLQDRFRKFH